MLIEGQIKTSGEEAILGTKILVVRGSLNDVFKMAATGLTEYEEVNQYKASSSELW